MAPTRPAWEEAPSIPDEAMVRVTGRLPTPDEYRFVRHLNLLQPEDPASITDDQLVEVFSRCPNLEYVILVGLADVVTDRAVLALARKAPNLVGLNLAKCSRVSDVGVLELANRALPLQFLIMNGLSTLTDPTLSAIAKTCPNILELECCDLPLITLLSVRDVWMYLKKLRLLRLGNCPLLADKAFPCVHAPGQRATEEEHAGLVPHLTPNWLEELSPLVLRHSGANLRVLDLLNCARLTDGAIEGIVEHAPRLQTLILSGLSLLTDASMVAIAKLGENLDVLMVANAVNLTDRGVVHLIRSCPNLRSIDLAFCRNLTDMTVFELANLKQLRRLSLLRVHKITDMAIHAIAEQNVNMDRLHISYNDQITPEAVYAFLQRQTRLTHLGVSGIPAFMGRAFQDLSDPPQPHHAPDQARMYRVYTGARIEPLRQYLAQEYSRRRDSELIGLHGGRPYLDDMATRELRLGKHRRGNSDKDIRGLEA